MGLFLKDINLKGKTALITGATKGLGRGAAIAIAQAGGNIIAVGRNQNELNSLEKMSNHNLRKHLYKQYLQNQFLFELIQFYWYKFEYS